MGLTGSNPSVVVDASGVSGKYGVEMQRINHVGPKPYDKQLIYTLTHPSMYVPNPHVQITHPGCLGCMRAPIVLPATQTKSLTIQLVQRVKIACETCKRIRRDRNETRPDVFLRNLRSEPYTTYSVTYKFNPPEQVDDVYVAQPIASGHGALRKELNVEGARKKCDKLRPSQSTKIFSFGSCT